MKKLFLGVLAAMLAWNVGCDNTPGEPTRVTTSVQGNVVFPGNVYNFQQSFASALNCDPAALVWSIQEASLSTWNAALDGSVTQAGIYTAPKCGSQYVGLVEHVQAVCSTSTLNPKPTGVAVINIGQEQLITLNAAAIVIDSTTGAGGCYDNQGFCTPVTNGVPGTPTTTACTTTATNTCASGQVCQLFTTVNTGGTIQFYAAAYYSCGVVMLDALPAQLPNSCTR